MKFEPLSRQISIAELLVVSDETTCGFGRFTPRCLQKYADPKVYLFVYSVLGMLQGAYFSYFIGIISTLEKRYAFNSQITGLILISNTLCPIFFSLFIGYFGGKTHRPRLISFCMLLVLLGCFLSVLPYFIYGPGLHILAKPTEIVGIPKEEFCEIKKSDEFSCKVEDDPDYTAVLIFFVASFLNGFGHTAFYVIGLPYLDDNVKKKNSPMYFSKLIFFSKLK